MNPNPFEESLTMTPSDIRARLGVGRTFILPGPESSDRGGFSDLRSDRFCGGSGLFCCPSVMGISNNSASSSVGSGSTMSSMVDGCSSGITSSSKETSVSLLDSSAICTSLLTTSDSELSDSTLSSGGLSSFLAAFVAESPGLSMTAIGNPINASISFRTPFS